MLKGIIRKLTVLANLSRKSCWRHERLPLLLPRPVALTNRGVWVSVVACQTVCCRFDHQRNYIPGTCGTWNAMFWLDCPLIDFQFCSLFSSLSLSHLLCGFNNNNNNTSIAVYRSGVKGAWICIHRSNKWFSNIVSAFPFLPFLPLVLCSVCVFEFQQSVWSEVSEVHLELDNQNSLLPRLLCGFPFEVFWLGFFLGSYAFSINE